MVSGSLLPRFAERAGAHVFDRIIVGGGLAATFAAYQYLRFAQQTGRPFRILLVAENFNAPCAAGNQLDLRLEGLLESDGQQDPRIRQIMHESIGELRRTIARENIFCRLSDGYELKAASQDELDHAIDLIVHTGVESQQDFTHNDTAQNLILPDHPHSAIVKGIGQVNVNEFLSGLRQAILRMGGAVHSGCSYTGLSRDDQGRFVVHTGFGDYVSSRKPLLASGARHMASLPEIQPAIGSMRYTMGIVIGPLSLEDARRVCNKPAAFSDTNIDERHDILWGGLDSENYLTIGWGELDDGSLQARDALQQKILTLIEGYYPGLLARYEPTINVSFAQMLRVKNELPVVGRLQHYDVSGGWGGFGIVPGFAAAQAWAQADVLGDEQRLRLFESLQPAIFKAGPAISPAPISEATL